MPAGDAPQELLAETRALTRRVQVAQRGAWFPLLVFGAVTFAAIPFNRYGPHAINCGAAGRGGRACIAYSVPALWFWPVAIAVGYVAIGWFYFRRSTARGVGTRVRPYVAVGLLVTLLATTWTLWAHAHPAFQAGSLGIGPGHATSEFLYRIASPASAIGVALVLLAWIERTWAALAVTSAYLVVAVTTVGIGHFAHPSPWAFLPHLLIDGTVLLVGGVLLAATDRAQRPSNA